VPTPTAGGCVIALIVTCWLLLADRELAYIFALTWTGLGFAILGGLDDLAPKGVVLRLFFQFGFGIIFASLILDSAMVTIGFLVVIIVIVSTVNIFNFMDGVDGFAGTQAALYLVAHIFFFAQNELVSYILYIAVLLGSVVGFLLLNMRDPAKIFMGDSGSYFIGFNLAAISIIGVSEGLSIWVPLILFSPFLTDATLTLAKRLITRETWWKPHRSHLYQKMVLGGMPPRKVCVKLILLNCLYCWPAAWLAHRYDQYSVLTVFIVYVSLSTIWYHHGKRYA